MGAGQCISRTLGNFWKRLGIAKILLCYDGAVLQTNHRLSENVDLWNKWTYERGSSYDQCKRYHWIGFLSRQVEGKVRDAVSERHAPARFQTGCHSLY